MILSHGYGLKEILAEELSKIGLQATLVDYKKPILPQISEAEILINGLGKIDKEVIDNCSRLKLVHQIDGHHRRRWIHIPKECH